MVEPEQEQDPHLADLFETVLALENTKECAVFFEDLCTAQELHVIAQRFAVAKMLAAGKKYSDIAARTGASTATISRVKRSLAYGAGGYRAVIGRTT